MLAARLLRAVLHARGPRPVSSAHARPALRSWRHCAYDACDKGSSEEYWEDADASFECDVHTYWPTAPCVRDPETKFWRSLPPRPEDKAHFRVDCYHRGVDYTVNDLPTQRHADQAADLLSIKAAFEEGQPWEDGWSLEEGVALRSRAQPFRGHELGKAGRSELAGITFADLHEQIERWVEGRWTWYSTEPPLLYQAAEDDSLVGTRLLLLLDPAAASAVDGPLLGYSPLQAACRYGSEQLVQLLLQAAPHMARVPDEHGRYPIHWAAASGNVGALRLLLQAAPDTAGAAFRSQEQVAAVLDRALARGDLYRPSGTDAPWHDRFNLRLDGETPLHLAAISSPDAVQLLLEAAPEAALEPDREGQMPLHCAASSSCKGAVQLLLAAAPEAALRTASPSFVVLQLERLHASGVLRSKRRGGASREREPADDGLTPLHIAAFWGRPGAVQELLAAAPAAAAMENRYGCTPLQLALAALSDKKMRTPSFRSDHRGAIRALLSTCSLPAAAEALLPAGFRAWPLLGELVAARLPLAEAEWALLPTPCPGLLPALPAALAHSLEQARQLVRRLPPTDKQRMRAAAQNLGQERQRDARTRLPVEAAQRLLFEQLHDEA